MSVQQLQKPARWAVIRDRIRCRPQAVKGIFAIVICRILAAQIRLGLVGVLLFVQPWWNVLSHSPTRDGLEVSLPFVDASQISIEALATGFFETASMTLPYTYATWAPSGIFSIQVSPFFLIL
jgi:hypothetical protein